MNTKEVDVRGLSCPQPVLEATRAMKEMGGGEILVLFDCEPARENVSRAAKSQGWTVAEVAEHGDHTAMLLKK